MNRLLSIACALSTLLLVSICSAQQTPDNKSTNSVRAASQAGIAEPAIGGGGTTNYIAIWTSSSNLGDSAIYQASGGKVGIGTTSPATTLDVNGNINTAASYSIAGAAVVNLGSPSDYNLFLGRGAGHSNVAGQGIRNAFSGPYAGYSNTTGHSNTFSGYEAGYYNTTGYDNTFLGYAAGEYNTAGSFNTFTGLDAGDHNTTGYNNTFSGLEAGYSNTTGYNNTFSGLEAGLNNTTGYNNTFSGLEAGLNNTSGGGNTFIGHLAGYHNTTGSNNIYIGNTGPSSGTESNTIRIGDSQTGIYIAGLEPGPGFPVCIGYPNGQLTTGCVLPSSSRFKEQVHDMGNSTNGLMKLRPVTFFYKPEYANGERTLQYGLIAEEVAEVYPELVAYDKDGKPYGVRYQYIATMLLNVVQKQYHRAEKQSEVIETQQQQIKEQQQQIKAQGQEIASLKQQLQVQNAALQQRLSRLEALARVEMAAAK
jgi:trimeric autotransporter adhesin